MAHKMIDNPLYTAGKKITFKFPTMVAASLREETVITRDSVDGGAPEEYRMQFQQFLEHLGFPDYVLNGDFWKRIQKHKK